MTTIIIEKQYDGDFRVKIQSDDPWTFQLCLDSLKLFVNAPFRRYDPATKHWLIAEAGNRALTPWLSHCHKNFHAQIKQSGAGR